MPNAQNVTSHKLQAQNLLYVFTNMRRQLPPLPEVVRNTLADVLGQARAQEALETPQGRTLLTLSTAIQESLDADTKKQTYHNGEHFKETVVAVAYLSALEFENHPLQTPAVLLSMLAMAGHDFKHDGTANTPTKSLEAIAWHACEPYLNELPEQDRAIVKAIIMGTEPTRLNEHRAVYTSSVVTPSMQDRLVLLACEADLTPSMLPGHGNAMGILYANELTQSGLPDLMATGKHIASWTSRLGFLHHAHPVSNAAHKLGLTNALNHQLEAFSTLADSIGLSTPKEAAGYLDDVHNKIDHETALQRYLVALWCVDTSLANAVQDSLKGPESISTFAPTM